MTLTEIPEFFKPEYAKYIRFNRRKIVTIPGAPSHIVKEVDAFNKWYYESMFPGQHYEDIKPGNAGFLFSANEDGSWCDLHNIGDAAATDVKLWYKEKLMMDKNGELKNLTIEPTHSVMLKMEDRIVKGATYVVTWKQKEKEYRDEIEIV